jgi:hypothetical protein
MPDDEFVLDLTSWDEQVAGQPLLGEEGEEGETGFDVEVQIPPWVGDDSLEDIYSAESLWKARELLDAEKVHWTSEARESAEVEGSTLYFVRITPLDGMTVPWLQCSCPNGQHRVNRPNCYHTAAVAALYLDADVSKWDRPPGKMR